MPDIKHPRPYLKRRESCTNKSFKRAAKRRRRLTQKKKNLPVLNAQRSYWALETIEIKEIINVRADL